MIDTADHLPLTVQECHVRRGLAVIVSVKTYEPHSPDTTADIDRKGLTALFRHHYQYTTLCLDRDRVSKREFNDFLFECRVHLQQHCAHYDVFLFAFSGHGNQDTIMLSDGEHFGRIDLFRYFNGSNCPNFKLKPKVFILDACKGPSASPRLSMSTRGPMVIAPDDNTIMLEANTPGHIAYEFAQSGGVMMQSVVKVMRLNTGRMTLDIMAKLVQMEMDRIGRNTETKQTMDYGQWGVVRNVVLWIPSEGIITDDEVCDVQVCDDGVIEGDHGETKKEGSILNKMLNRLYSAIVGGGGGRKRSLPANCRGEVEVGERPYKRRRLNGVHEIVNCDVNI